MIITESELRELWRNRPGTLPAFPPGTRFSPAAQDFIKTHQVELRFEASPPLPVTNPQSLSLPTPDSPLEHHRATLRSQIDLLNAAVMLVAAEARRYQLPRLAEGLETLAVYCHEIRSAEYYGRVAQPLDLGRRTEEELQALSR